jgi:hypothetical protein
MPTMDQLKTNLPSINEIAWDYVQYQYRARNSAIRMEESLLMKALGNIAWLTHRSSDAR